MLQGKAAVNVFLPASGILWYIYGGCRVLSSSSFFLSRLTQFRLPRPFLKRLHLLRNCISYSYPHNFNGSLQVEGSWYGSGDLWHAPYWYWWECCMATIVAWTQKVHLKRAGLALPSSAGPACASGPTIGLGANRTLLWGMNLIRKDPH